MKQKIAVVPFGTTKSGKPASLFRIPNSTNDYIELSTYGCALKRICIHAFDGSMRNLLAEPSPLAEDEGSTSFRGMLSLGDSKLSAVLSHTVWEVAETGENYIFLTCRICAETGELTAGVRVMWVNLNRLVADFFVTPEHDTALNMCSELILSAGTANSYFLRTFCPLYRADGAWQAVAQSPYGELSFQPLTDTVSFSVPESADVCPMAELADKTAQTAISIYGNLPVILVKPLETGVQVLQLLGGPAALQGGQTCSSRVIFGFDRLFTEKELTNPAPNPFSAFL